MSTFPSDRFWFGPDLGGVSNDQYESTPDAEALARHDLPLLQNEGEVADWLGIPLSRLRWFTHDQPVERVWHYTRRTIPKRNGGERVILAPKCELKTLQRKVLRDILDRVPAAGPAHGFVHGRSIVTNARPHVGKKFVLNLDLKDFFPGITFARVRGVFQTLGYPFGVAAALALLCTERDREEFGQGKDRYYVSLGPRHTVQGAPTSPALANRVAYRLDRRLAGLAKKHRFTYTRYADDLTFSGDDYDAALRTLDAAQRIIGEEDFRVNGDKTRLHRRKGRQVVTGLVVNEQVSTPRQLRKKLRAILHNAGLHGLESQNRDGHPDFYGYLAGLIGHVHAANPSQAQQLLAALRGV
jgi:hypothetical protein